MVICLTIWFSILFKETFRSQFRPTMNTSEMFHVPSFSQGCHNLTNDGFLAQVTSASGDWCWSKRVWWIRFGRDWSTNWLNTNLFTHFQIRQWRHQIVQFSIWCHSWTSGRFHDCSSWRWLRCPWSYLMRRWFLVIYCFSYWNTSWRRIRPHRLDWFTCMSHTMLHVWNELGNLTRRWSIHSRFFMGVEFSRSVNFPSHNFSWV